MLETSHASELLHSSLRDALRASVLRSGTLVLQGLHVASAALVHAPTLDDRAGALERARELLLQLEHATALYRELSNAELLAEAERLLPQAALPATWLEAAAAQLVVALATLVLLDHSLQLTGTTTEATLFARACQAEHCNAARAALEELDAGSATQHAEFRSSLDHWRSRIVPALGEDALRSKYLLELDRLTRDLRVAH